MLLVGGTSDRTVPIDGSYANDGYIYTSQEGVAGKWAEAQSCAAEPVAVDRARVGAGMRIADIGPRTREFYARELASARTVIWNGPMGIFELAPFAAGTARVAEALVDAAESGAVVVLGGGDSASAAAAFGVGGRMTHVSTGGGASLDLLAGHELPGISVLERGSGG